MANWQYNTDHGNFQIEGRKKPALLKALNDHLGDTIPEPFDDIYDAFQRIGFEIIQEESPYTGNIDDEEGDILDVQIANSNVSEENWKTLETVVAPFVTAGSFLVFYAEDGCFAITFEKNKETDLVEGCDEEVEAVPCSLMKRIFKSLKDKDPVLYQEVCSKYEREAYKKD
jgi:hypothetical protein